MKPLAKRYAELALAGLIALLPAAATAQDDCSVLTPGDYSCQIETPDGLRDFLVHVPAVVDPGTPVPLVVDMHGYTSNAVQQRAISGWEAKADAEGFIVAWPQGLGDAWNSQGQCCAFFGTQDDVSFIEAVVAEIQAGANIDPGQIFATGLSNGGSQTHTMACESAHLFAAAAPVSFGLSGGSTYSAIVANCNPSEGIPVIHFHGTADETVSYTSGVLDSLGAQASLDAWAEIQDCDPLDTDDPIAPDTLCETHSNCMDDAAVTLCTVTDGTHVLYGQLDGVTIPDVAWDYFQSFQPAPTAAPVPLLPGAGRALLLVGLSAAGWITARSQKRA